jgi:tripeptide aminopeptidase
MYRRRRESRVIAPAAVDRDRLVRTFLDLVAIDSPSGHEERIGQELERRFSACGTSVVRDMAGNLVATCAGTRGETFMVSTHMDTVGTDVGIRPIVGGDGVIRTDGSTILGADDKSGIAACLELLTLFGAHPEWHHPTIEFVVTVGEEVGLVGSRQLDVGQLRSTHGFVLDTAGAVGSITYWAPTAVDLTIWVHGKKAHAWRGAGEGDRCPPGRRRGSLDDAAGPDRRRFSRWRPSRR